MSSSRKVPKVRNFGYVAEFLQRLDDRGIPYTYDRAVPVAEIHREEGSQARIDHADKLFVQRYQALIEAGGVTKFPPIVLWQDGFQGYRTLDGNHRLQAARNKHISHVDTIIVDVPDEQTALIVSAWPNLGNGKAYTDEEVQRIAAVMADQGAKPAEIAEQVGITIQRVNNLLAAHRFDERCTRLGITGTEALNRATKGTLGAVADDSVFNKLTELARDAKMSAADLSPIKKAIDAATSEAGRLQAVEDARIDNEDKIEAVRIGKSMAPPVSMRAGGALGTLATLIGQTDDTDDWLPKRAATRREWVANITTILPFLPLLEDALNEALESDEDDDEDLSA